LQLNMYLLKIADIWTATNDRSLSRLSTIAVNDGKFFASLKRGSSCTVTRFETVLSFFRNGENWKDNCIPDSAGLLLDELDNISTGAVGAGGKPDNNTAAGEKVAA